jgi:hypothetical protein
MMAPSLCSSALRQPESLSVFAVDPVAAIGLTGRSYSRGGLRPKQVEQMDEKSG